MLSLEHRHHYLIEQFKEEKLSSNPADHSQQIAIDQANAQAGAIIKGEGDVSGPKNGRWQLGPK